MVLTWLLSSSEHQQGQQGKELQQDWQRQQQLLQ